MNKVKLLRGKFPLFSVLSLGVMVLGIGCIFWAMFSMRTPSSYTGSVVVNEKLEPSLGLSTQNKNLYPIYPSTGENIGSLTIPALKRKLPIFQGTGDEELKKGVGHFAQSVLPGEEDNCVLSGHRDTVFRQIGNLKIGDQLIVQTSAGTFTYEVKATRIVHENDKSVIVPTEHGILTMTTCYPFYAIGNAPDRYIVSATLVRSE